MTIFGQISNLLLKSCQKHLLLQRCIPSTWKHANYNKSNCLLIKHSKTQYQNINVYSVKTANKQISKSLPHSFSSFFRTDFIERLQQQRYLTSNNVKLFSIISYQKRTLLRNKFYTRPLEWTYRWRSHKSARASKKNKTVVLYVLAATILVGGLSYAAVPLYAVFCQATGLGGQATKGHDTEKVESMTVIKNRQLLIKFNADTAASMRWNFRPQQPEVKVYPGETALAFYSAVNPTDKPIVGISTYNVVPFDAGQYFNKIQCFCFEEQRLNPHEQVDMPVFFYIDPEFAEDPRMANVDRITLSYTFFEAKEGLQLPDPWMKH
ncbi:cytochrome c oxidase assembly protein ctaG-like [Antedon mediterranea]|uniref:cytochrome c oxidase assembly protein ctaG-like n=1 Tax=Antedon mediterranea TaxID=105859 RepID=UPI003AF44315